MKKGIFSLNFRLMEKIIIAIDGPAGSGKSTTAQLLATLLNYLYIDTGAMYRAVTYLALKNGITNDEEAIVNLLLKTDIELVYSDGVTKVLLDGEDVTEPLRSKIVNDHVSFISKIKDVRKELVRRQKKMGEAGGVVMEGRDIGTVVFPNAQLKIFLIANLEIRAERRLHEVKQKGTHSTYSDIKENLLRRDTIDSSREVDPLTKAPDAYTVDTTELTIEQQVAYIYGLALDLLNKK